MTMPRPVSRRTLYEYAGGDAALRRLEQIFYDRVFADALLRPLFGAGRPEHVDRLTAFTAESSAVPTGSRVSWASRT